MGFRLERTVYLLDIFYYLLDIFCYFVSAYDTYMITEQLTPKSLKSKVLKLADIRWRDLQFIQQDSFKELSEEEKTRLKRSLIENNFIQPFYVWQDVDSLIWCLDGKHRSLCQYELQSAGNEIPEYLPAIFIDCADKQEAAKLTLIYSSLYAKVQYQGLFDFIQMYELNYDTLKSEMHLPEVSMDRFEQKFNLYGIGNNDEEQPEVAPVQIVNEGDLFEINGHRIICGSFRDAETVELLMKGQKARIVSCDPPYNLPANFFTNKDEKRHKDFAMGAGEMSDDEFVEFLALIMQRSVENSVPGAIHFIFMDFRHAWHMCEAARRVYGSPIPKQQITWYKDIMANGSFYRAQKELCFAFSNEAAASLWNNDLIDEGGFYKNESEHCYIFKNGNGAKHLSHLELKDRIRTNVWKYPSAISTANPDRKELKNHPTPKPVAMIADSILDTTNPGEIVIDWFLGSGTCLIACEKTKRFCYTTEIEPIYVQNDIKRYINYCEKNDINIKFEHINGSLTLKDFTNGKTYSSGENN